MADLLITNAYDARNRGDAAIVLGMIESFRRTELLGGAQVTVSSAGFPGDCARYDVPVVPSFVSLQRDLPGGRVLGRGYFIALLLPLSCLWGLVWRLTGREMPLPGELARVLRAYARADLVVAAGGGYLYTTSRRRGNVVLLMHLYSFLFGALLGKPVYAYAQSIGPFAARWQARLVRAALDRLRLVEVREAWSRNLLAGVGLRARVVEAADAAFLLPAAAAETDACPTRQGRLRLGVTVREWFREIGRQRRYEQTMAAFLDRAISEYGAEVVFLPQVTVTDRNDDDTVVARRVRSSMRRPDHASIVEGETNAGAVKRLCAQMDVVVGTRMHSNVFALSSGVPVLAVAYQPKTRGIMEQLGLAEFVVEIEDLSLESLTDAFLRLRSEHADVRARLAQALPRVVRSAECAGRAIADDFSAFRGDSAASRRGST